MPTPELPRPQTVSARVCEVPPNSSHWVESHSLLFLLVLFDLRKYLLVFLLCDALSEENCLAAVRRGTMGLGPSSTPAPESAGLREKQEQLGLT